MNENKKTSRRFSLAFKLNSISIAILLAFVAGIVYINFRVQQQRITDEYFASAEQAATYLSDLGGTGGMMEIINAIESDEFAAVHQEAVAADDGSIISNWLSGQKDEMRDFDESDPLPYDLNDLYETFNFMLLEALGKYDINDAYFTYYKDGRPYYLISCLRGPLAMGTEAPVVYGFDEYAKDDLIPARLYQDQDKATVARACAYLTDYETGKTFGLICTEVNMASIASVTMALLRQTMNFTIIITILAILLNIILIRRFAVKPLKDLAAATCAFGAGSDGYSMDDVINVNIRYNDEINDLYQEIRAMQTRIVKYTGDLTSLTKEKARAETELQLAANIQQSMLKDSKNAFPGGTSFKLSAMMDPAREVGGDFYDFFFTDEDHLALIIADVSGKGIPAALFMMSAMLLIRSHAASGDSPAAILEAVNNEISASNEAKMFVTVWIGIMDVNTGTLLCSNAGHEYPAIAGSDGTFSLFKDRHGLVIGYMEGVKYTDYEIRLEKGGTLFVYTDGLPEADNVEKDFYGTDRMLEALTSNASYAPDDLLINMRGDVEKFADGAEQFDDLTMLCIRYEPD